MHRCWGVPRPLQIHRLTVLLWGSHHTSCAFPEAAKGEPAESAQQHKRVSSAAPLPGRQSESVWCACRC